MSYYISSSRQNRRSSPTAFVGTGHRKRSALESPMSSSAKTSAACAANAPVNLAWLCKMVHSSARKTARAASLPNASALPSMTPSGSKSSISPRLVCVDPDKHRPPGLFTRSSMRIVSTCLVALFVTEARICSATVTPGLLAFNPAVTLTSCCCHGRGAGCPASGAAWPSSC